MLVSFLTEKLTIYVVRTRIYPDICEIIFDYLLLCSYSVCFKFLYGSLFLNDILCSEMMINLFSVAQGPKLGLGGLTFEVLDYTHTKTHTHTHTQRHTHTHIYTHKETHTHTYTHKDTNTHGKTSVN